MVEKKARNGLRNRSNVAADRRSTAGPGNIGLLTILTCSENQSSLTVSLTRDNGDAGFTSPPIFAVQSGLAQAA